MLLLLFLDESTTSMPQLTVSEESTTSTPQTESVGSAGPVTKVLFVGDSFTSYKAGLLYHIPKLADSAAPPLNVEANWFVRGDSSLDRHWNDLGTPDKIVSGDYDIVVLQSLIPASDVETFKENVRDFVELIRHSGAEPVLYMTWAYDREDWITMDEIAQAHTEIATELGVPVAPVGLAFERAMSERPELNMRDFDNERQSTYGSHLLAYVIYLTIFGVEAPDTVTDLMEGDPITDADVKFLHRIARETVNAYTTDQSP